MPRPGPLNAWSDLSTREVNRRLRDIGLVVCKSEEVLICTRCKYALQPSGQTVSKHLWEKHCIPAKERAGLYAFVQSLDLPDPNSVTKHSDGDPAHPHLLAQSGFACLRCEYRTTSQNLVKRHLSQEHGLQVSSASTDNDRYWSEVTLQSWTPNGKREFWIVGGPRDESVDLVQQSPRRKRKLSEICQAEADRVAQRGRFLREGTPYDPLLSSNWMRRTGWAQIFSGMDLRLLLKMIQSPMTTHGERVALGTLDEKEVVTHAADECRLRTVSLAIDRFFDRCEDTVRNTDHSLLCWLRSQHRGNSYKAPFELPGRIATQKRYRVLWKKIVFFCMRAHVVRTRDVSGAGLNLPFSEDAWLVIRKLWTSIPETAVYQPLTACDHAEDIESDDADEDSSQSEDSDDECDETLDTAPMQDELRNRLCRIANPYNSGTTRGQHGGRRHRVTSPANAEAPDSLFQDCVAEFCAYICTEPYRDGRAGTTIMVFIAGVLGIAQDGMSFERPKNYTSEISALLHSARLCMLEATLPWLPHANLGWGPRPSLGQVDILNQMREQYLCQGSTAPVSELLSLRAYGRVLARKDGPAFRVDWTDGGTSIKWEHGALTMTAFRALGHHAVRVVQENIDAIMGSFRPNLNLSVLRDRISEHNRGYSFVQDPTNGMKSRYLDLANSICAGPEHGLLTQKGWSLRSVRQFLRKEESLLEQIMLMMYLRGGQASRTTEFFSLRCENGASTSRGIYVHGGSIMYVTRHSKARRSTNQEFQVARYLPEGESLALATYLVYIRPLAAMIYRSAFNVEREERKFLFCSADEPGKPWQGTRMTSALRRLTREVAGLDIGVQTYRQLSIAVTEKHLAHLSSPFNRYDDKTGNARLEVAFAWQSGHRPLQRGTSYGIDAAFPDSLQPALLRVYRWASNEWHRFLDKEHDRQISLEVSTREPANTQANKRAPRKKRRAAAPLLKTISAHTRLARTHTGSETSLRTTLTWVSENEAFAPQTIPTTINLCQPSHASESNRLSQEAPVNDLQRTSGYEFVPEAGRMDSSMKTTASQSSDRHEAVQCFHHNSTHRVLICKEHGYAVASWRRHVSDFHAFAKTEIKDIGRLLQHLDVVRPENALVPPPNGPPIQHLQQSRVGFQCRGTSGKDCGQLSSRRAVIAEHCNRMHDWRSSPESRTNWNEVKIQSFCLTPGKQRWFIMDG
jgi:hypothetical protein